jgi:hypothetical protein
MKYRVKKNATLLYPDGSSRGTGGYVVDGQAGYDRQTVLEQADVLERCADRQAPASPVDLPKLSAPASPTAGADSATPGEEAAPKRATKKKKKKKKRLLSRRDAEDSE